MTASEIAAELQSTMGISAGAAETAANTALGLQAGVIDAATMLPSSITAETLAAANASLDPIAALNAAAGWTPVDAAYLSSIGFDPGVLSQTAAFNVDQLFNTTGSVAESLAGSYGPGGARYVFPVDLTAAAAGGSIAPGVAAALGLGTVAALAGGGSTAAAAAAPLSPLTPTVSPTVQPVTPVEVTPPVEPPVIPEGPMGPPSPFEPGSPEFVGPPAPEGPVGPPSPFEPGSPEFNGPPAPTDTGAPVVDRTPDWTNPNPTPDKSILNAAKDLGSAVIESLTPAQIAAGWVLVNGIATPPKQPTQTGYGPIDPLTFKHLTSLTTPGTNPGYFVRPTPYYATTSPVQSQYYWGQHPYQTGDQFSQAQYNAVPAPVQPFGLQQLYTPTDISQYLQQLNKG